MNWFEMRDVGEARFDCKCVWTAMSQMNESRG